MKKVEVTIEAEYTCTASTTLSIEVEVPDDFNINDRNAYFKLREVQEVGEELLSEIEYYIDILPQGVASITINQDSEELHINEVCQLNEDGSYDKSYIESLHGGSNA